MAADQMAIFKTIESAMGQLDMVKETFVQIANQAEAISPTDAKLAQERIRIIDKTLGELIRQKNTILQRLYSRMSGNRRANGAHLGL
jgi:hypothetical protein